MKKEETPNQPEFSGSELAALAHLYRGELYRSKVWRQRLDTTTNWAVALTGISLSITFGNPQLTPLPLLLVGLMVFVFLYIEARRYRYFDIWRTRVRLLEVYFYGPMLIRQPILGSVNWNQVLAQDMAYLHFHISIWEALGRRLRRNYSWIFAILGISFFGKLLVHPTPLQTLEELWQRAAIGPVSGQVVFFMGAIGYGALTLLSLTTMMRQEASGRTHPGLYDHEREDPIMRMAI
jgi:uncharacterized membrane protein